MVPTFSWGFAVPPPAIDRPARNGWDYDEFAGPTAGLGRVYDPSSNEIDADMGAVAAAALGMKGRVRGNHPLCSFTAVGPKAEELVTEQAALDFCAPVRALASAEGLAVLMGVNLTAMTALHLAEKMAGRRLFIRWANGPDRVPMRVEVGGCSQGFDKLAPLLRPLARRVEVGHSVWRIFPVQDLLSLAAGAIKRNPMTTHCGSPKCERCNDAAMGGPIV